MICIIIPIVLMSAVHKLKPGKSDCIDNMYSDNLRNGTHNV